MGRVPRRRMGKGIYHVINRGINNSWILSEEKDRYVFLALLDKQRAAYKLNVYHYAVMGNHFHLAIEAIDMRELSAYIGSVCSLYSIYWHEQRGNGRGTIWQGRYKSIPVQKEGYMNRLGRYIERNPFVANMENVANLEDYKWSSAAAYILGKEDPLVEITQHPYWNQWGRKEDKRRINYGKYLRSPNEEDVKIFASSVNMIGDNDFKARIRLQGGRFSTRSVGRPRRII